MVAILAFSLHHEADAEEMTQTLQEEFNDYRYLSSFVREKDYLRVPLVSLISYKGITTLVRAESEGREKRKSDLKTELQRLEQRSHIAMESFLNNCNFK